MRVVIGPDQLNVNVHPIAGLLDAAFEYIGSRATVALSGEIFWSTAVAAVEEREITRSPLILESVVMISS